MGNFLKSSRFFILILIAICALIAIAVFLVRRSIWQLPAANQNQGIKGIVLIGPTCPVERTPPDPRCADRPLATSLAIVTADGTQVIKKFNSGSDGKFSIDLPVGEYIIRSADTVKFYPRCDTNGTIKVAAGQYADTTVDCDSGIR